MYQIGLLGEHSEYSAQFVSGLNKRLLELGIPHGISVLREEKMDQRDRKFPLIALFFGYEGASDAAHSILRELSADSTLVIPCLPEGKNVANEAFIPKSLHHVNSLQLGAKSEEGTARLASLVLENFRLLRKERRLFISYRRVEAPTIAIQLYEQLDAKGFDVFLDTRGIPPAADFQEVLWHRMTDCDVVIIVDTPQFRGSRWTRAELARANAMSIQVLDIMWPGVHADEEAAFSQFFQLEDNNFASTDQIGITARLNDETVDLICMEVEVLRARAMAARERYLIDNFCDQARDLGAQASIEAERYIDLRLSNGTGIAVVPTVGIPTADRCQEIQAAIEASNESFNAIWLLYDERGILQRWLDHLEWLNGHLPIKSVRVSFGTSAMEGGTS